MNLSKMNLITILIVFSAHCLYADVNKSISDILKSAKSESYKNKDSASTLLKRAFELSRKHDNKTKFIVRLQMLEFLYENTENKEIMKLFNSGEISLPKVSRNDSATFFAKLSNIYFKLNLRSSAINYSDKAYDIVFSDNIDSAKLMILLDLSKSYRSLGKFSKTISILDKLKNYVNNTNHDLLGLIFLNLGRAYLDVKNYDMAFIKLQKSIRILERAIDTSSNLSKKNHLKKQLFNSYNNYGIAYMENGIIEKANNNFNKALKLAQEFNNDYYKAQVITNIAGNFLNQEIYDSAYFYSKKAYLISLNLNSPEGMAINLINMSASEFKLNKAKDSYNNIVAAQKIIDSFNIVFLKPQIFGTWSNYYEAVGEFDKSLDYLKRFVELKDSIFDSELKLDLIRVSSEYEDRVKQIEKESQIKLKNAEYDRNKKIQILISIIVFLVLITMIYIIISKTKINKEIKQKNDEISIINEKLSSMNLNLRKSIHSKDKLFSIISHDLKSPLSGISNLLIMMNENIDKSNYNENKLNINLLINSVESINKLLDNLLTWSRSQIGLISFEPKKEDLYLLVNDVFVSLYQFATSKQISLINNISTGVIDLQFDYNLMKIVIHNLVSNAIKFTRNGGYVSVNLISQNDNVLIIVEDNGVGLSQEEIDSLFRVGEETKKIYSGVGNKGTGLGLIICKEFVDMHSGKIDIISEKGKGSKFIITLPHKRKDNQELARINIFKKSENIN